MYILVEFLDDHEVAIIPDNWLSGTKCAVWPVHFKDTRKVESAVKKKLAPGDSWPALPIREMYRNMSYSSVRKNLKKSEMESDLATQSPNSDSEEDSRRPKRKKQLPARLYLSSEDEREVPISPASPCQDNMCSLPQRPSPLKTGCYETSLARSHSQQPVPATVHTSTTPARSTSTPSVRDCASATSTSVTGTPRSEAARDIRMFTLMEAMSRRQVELLETMNQVLGIVSKMAKVEGVRSSEKPENLNLPASTSEELEALEAALEEGECFNGLVSYLSVQGGVSTADMVRRVMRQCLTNQLAVQFNWFGKKGKRAFGKLKLAQAVTKAVMKCKKCTAVEVELGCREWFRMASDRDGGRKKRKRPSSSMGESFQD